MACHHSCDIHSARRRLADATPTIRHSTSSTPHARARLPALPYFRRCRGEGKSTRHWRPPCACLPRSLDLGGKSVLTEGGRRRRSSLVHRECPAERRAEVPLLPRLIRRRLRRAERLPWRCRRSECSVRPCRSRARLLRLLPRRRPRARRARRASAVLPARSTRGCRTGRASRATRSLPCRASHRGGSFRRL